MRAGIDSLEEKVDEEGIIVLFGRIRENTSFIAMVGKKVQQNTPARKLMGSIVRKCRCRNGGRSGLS